jgi:tagatose 1,6-diphosphate aldolase
VIQSLAEFSRDRHSVDVMKVEFTVDLKYLEGARAFRGPAIWRREQALEFYRQAAAATSKPFIYLSAGVGIDEFIESLELAVESQVRFSGVLCGRAAWQDGVHAYARGGAKTLEEWLDREGERNFGRVIEMLKTAKPCCREAA